MTRSYPSGLPCPLVDGYSVAVKMHSYSGGSPIHNDQRRTYKNMPHFFSLAFVLNRKDWNQWHNFMRAYGYSWFSIPLQTAYTAKDPKNTSRTLPIDIRLTSPLRVTSITKDYVKVQVNAESSPVAVDAMIGA